MDLCFTLFTLRLFEPGRYLACDHGGVIPCMVPTQHLELLSSAYGLLLNELYYSPDSIIKAVLSLLDSSLALDTGSVCDVAAQDFCVSVEIILYIVRLAGAILVTKLSGK